jgi:hypothetical protein
VSSASKGLQQARITFRSFLADDGSVGESGAQTFGDDRLGRLIGFSDHIETRRLFPHACG